MRSTGRTRPAWRATSWSFSTSVGQLLVDDDFLARGDPQHVRNIAVGREHPQVALDICGSGDPNHIAELRHLSAAVEAKGNISDHELDAKLRACFAVVLPSLHEGYPLTLLEACSYGKPFVASSVGSISEIFSNRKCAILVPPGDTTALENAMATLMSEDALIYAERAADARLAFEELSTPATILAALAA